MRLSDEHGVYWENNNKLACNFSDLFLNNIEVSTINKNMITYPSWRIATLEDDDIPDNFTITTSNLDLAGNQFSFTCPHGRNIDLEYHRIPFSVKLNITKTFNKLMINS